MDKKQSSDHYKRTILEEYPESDYAKLIRDPKSLEKEKESDQKVKAHYEKTLREYQNGRFLTVISRSDSALSNGTGDRLRAKYLLLKALSLGRSDSVEAAKMTLQKVIKEHREKPEGKKAQKILDRLNDKMNSPTPEVDIEETPFKEQSSKPHYFCIIVPKNSSADPGNIENGVSDFNRKYFSQKSSLKVGNNLLRSKDHLIHVKKFQNKKEGMDYYRTFIQRSPVLKALDMKKAKIFLISQENFGIMFRQQKSDEYMSFFRKAYLDQ